MANTDSIFSSLSTVVYLITYLCNSTVLWLTCGTSKQKHFCLLNWSYKNRT